MEEKWKKIRNFDYDVSNFGQVRSRKSGRIMRLSMNQYGCVCVGMMKDGEQKHRSVALLVAKAFLTHRYAAFDTPINLDGDRWNNHVDNLEWRPRWFAIKYNRQFKEPYAWPINRPIEDVATQEVSENSLECAIKYGLLEEDVVMSIMNRTVTWPTYQQFQIVGL